MAFKYKDIYLSDLIFSQNIFEDKTNVLIDKINSLINKANNYDILSIKKANKFVRNLSTEIDYNAKLELYDFETNSFSLEKINISNLETTDNIFTDNSYFLKANNGKVKSLKLENGFLINGKFSKITDNNILENSIKNVSVLDNSIGKEQLKPQLKGFRLENNSVENKHIVDFEIKYNLLDQKIQSNSSKLDLNIKNKFNGLDSTKGKYVSFKKIKDNSYDGFYHITFGHRNLFFDSKILKSKSFVLDVPNTYSNIPFYNSVEFDDVYDRNNSVEKKLIKNSLDYGYIDDIYYDLGESFSNRKLLSSHLDPKIYNFLLNNYKQLHGIK